MLLELPNELVLKVGLSLRVDVWMCGCVDVCGCVWMCVDVCGCVWMCMDVCGCVWMCMDV